MPGPLPRNVTWRVTGLVTPWRVRSPVRSASWPLTVDLCALEGHRRELIGVEEIGPAQVLVAHRVCGIDALDADRGIDAGVLGVIGIDVDGAGDFGEAPGDVAEEVADLEAHGGVDRVDLERIGL